MELLISLPDEFAEHFNFDAFQDSFNRIKSDISTNGCLSGRYERELVDALTSAFFKAKYSSTEADTLNSVHISKGDAYDMLRKAGIPVKMDKDKNVCFVSGSCVITAYEAYLTLTRNVYNEIRSLYYVSIPTNSLTKAHIKKFITRYKALEKEILK